MEVQKFLELLPQLNTVIENLKEEELEKLLPGVNNALSNKEVQQLVQLLPTFINIVGQMNIPKQLFPLLPGLSNILEKIEAQEILQFLPGLNNLLSHLNEQQISQLLPGVNHILNNIETQQLLHLLPNLNNILNNMDVRQFLHLIPGLNNVLSKKKRKTLELLPGEREKLDIFRARVNSIYPFPDFKLIAWLRARDLDLDKAEQMLRRHVLWKKNNQLTQALKFEITKVYFPLIISGFDFEGTPVLIAPSGRFDVRGIVESGDVLAPMVFAMKTGEMLETAGTLVGISQVNIIIDMDAFSYYQIVHRTVIQAMIEGVRIFEANFPEVLKNAFVINAPKVFHLLFAMIKPFMHSRTLSKVQIFDHNETKWKQAIFKIMAKDQIPPHWGGSKIGKDKYCSEAWFQPPLAPNYMRKIGQSRDDYGEEWINVKVEAGEELGFEYYVDIGQPPQRLKWAFRTEGYNIGFSLVKEGGDFREDREDIIEYKLVESHERIEEGSAKLDKAGKYILTFHNHFSRSRSKYVHYQITLMEDVGVEMKSKNLGP